MDFSQFAFTQNSNSEEVEPTKSIENTKQTNINQTKVKPTKSNEKTKQNINQNSNINSDQIEYIPRKRNVIKEYAFTSSY